MGQPHPFTLCSSLLYTLQLGGDHISDIHLNAENRENPVELLNHPLALSVLHFRPVTFGKLSFLDSMAFD